MFRLLSPPLVALALGIALAGCGSASSTAPPASTATAPPTNTGQKPRVDEGARQFELGGGDNSIQESGSEASGSELAAAAKALHAFLDARAAGAWALVCEHLSSGIYEQLTDLAGRGGRRLSCPEVLAGLSAGLPHRALREAAVADVGSFRVEGDSGFILFHGAHHVDWFMPMVREGDRWKVAAIAPSALS